MSFSRTAEADCNNYAFLIGFDDFALFQFTAINLKSSAPTQILNFEKQYIAVYFDRLFWRF
jgi:hypothetical protein